MSRKNNPSPSWRVYKPEGRSISVPTATLDHGLAVENDTFLWSLADLMTLLLIFFVMLYANTIHQDPIKERPAVRTMADSQTAADDTFGVFPEGGSEMDISPKEGYASRPEQPGPVAGEATQASPATENLNRQMMVELADSFSQDFYIRWDERQPVIVLGERITFNVGDAMLLADAHGALKRVATLIAKLGNCRVIVSGHTDNRPIRTPTFPSNWELSAARAASVAKALMANGIAPHQLTIQGRSEFNPLSPNTTATNRRANRRVEISVITSN